MKHIREAILLAIVFALPFVVNGHVSAASDQVVQELHVTAKVPHHRDIVIDNTGNITHIYSNTKQDVKPDVYLGSVEPKNKKPLTDKLYKQYRKHVPTGTAEYGILYQKGIPVSLFNSKYTSSKQTYHS